MPALLYVAAAVALLGLAVGVWMVRRELRLWRRTTGQTIDFTRPRIGK